MALVLVCGLGLTGGEAWAQVKDAVKALPVLPKVVEADLAELTEVDQEKDISLAFTGSIEKMPEYPGGNKALMRFLYAHIQYPKGFCVDGKVFINFTVTKMGDVRDVKILRGLGGAFDTEAVRVVSLLGKWTPGTQNNVPVDVDYTVPINFSLGPVEKPKSKRRKL